MIHLQRFLPALGVAVLLAPACAHAPQGPAPAEPAHVHPAPAPRRFVPEGAGAPLFNDLGTYQRAVTTRSTRAGQYFAQGLVLAYGFNHAEAVRSFREAWRQDPECAMCFWGEAYALGPNINKPMDDADVPRAWEASRQALDAADGASPVEQALVRALALRYAEAPVPDRTGLDRAYADAMRDVAETFPDDLDVQVLAAEALMDTMPWDYYEDPTRPRPATVEVVRRLESVLERRPDHPGALHFLIHALEPSDRPERAEPAADRLRDLVPGAGHLVHMPAHVYLRVGRYHDASEVNVKAAAADESYISQCRAQGFYPAAYYPHNIHFLYTAAAYEGRSQVSIEAARRLVAAIPPEVVADIPSVEEFLPMELYALARFGRWQEVLAAPAPDLALRYTTGVWHYVRGMARAATGDPDAARQELAALRGIGAEAPLAELQFASFATPALLLGIGARVLEARIAGEAGEWVRALAPLREAVAVQDALPYTEPPAWYFPVREALGQALLESGRPAEAEAVFREQLRHTPRNGWSLHGLALALRAQGRSADALAVERDFAEAWSLADVPLRAPVF